MPNHVHGIIVIVWAQFIASSGMIALNRDGAMEKGAINRAPTGGEIMRAFKVRCTNAINEICKTQGSPIWQRNYYEHFIRDEDDLDRIHKYIIENQLKWVGDGDNPTNNIP